MGDIPKHVAIILDGNRRWARVKGKRNIDGHKSGLDNLIKLSEHIFNQGIKILSVYAFSTENFKRNPEEVKYLMDLLVNNLGEGLKKIVENNIKVVFSGKRDNLDKDVLKTILSLEEKSKDKDGAIFNICFNYGGHQEIIDATKKIINANLALDDITPELFQKYLYQDLPPVDLMIRTGGELRLSGFLLWQVNYAEFYFTDILFPDFNNHEFDLALEEYNNRNRRFGGNK